MQKYFYRLLAAILGLLGFSNCIPSSSRVEYGSPSASYKFLGEATDPDGQPVEGIRVVVAPNGLDPARAYDNDTLYTAADGTASKERLKYNWPGTKEMTVKFEQVPEGGFDSVILQEKDLVIQKTEEGRSHWDNGLFTITAKARLPKK